MPHEFVILIEGQLHTFTEYEDIPNKFDNVIKFLPEILDGPHSHEQHEEIHTWNEKLKLLMKKENASNN